MNSFLSNHLSPFSLSLEEKVSTDEIVSLSVQDADEKVSADEKLEKDADEKVEKVEKDADEKEQ
jgi:hypothetical protein